MKAVRLSRDVVEKKLEEIVSRIVEAEQPERVILFGSWAAGHARPDSDVDLMVVVRDGGDTMATAVRLYRLLAGMGVPKDLVVVTVRDFERFKDTPGTVVKVAHLEGRVLYERSS